MPGREPAEDEVRAKDGRDQADRVRARGRAGTSRAARGARRGSRGRSARSSPCASARRAPGPSGRHRRPPLDEGAVPLGELEQAEQHPLVVGAAGAVGAHEPGHGLRLDQAAQRRAGRVAGLDLLAERLAQPAVVGGREAVLRVAPRSPGAAAAPSTGGAAACRCGGARASGPGSARRSASAPRRGTARAARGPPTSTSCPRRPAGGPAGTGACRGRAPARAGRGRPRRRARPRRARAARRPPRLRRDRTAAGGCARR